MHSFPIEAHRTNQYFLRTLVSVTAEFIIHLAEKNNTLDKFKKVLVENGAEFSVSNLRSVKLYVSLHRSCNA